MVVHDETRTQEWAQEREEKQKKKSEKPRFALRLSVVAVQSIACGVAVVLALLLRMAGGEAYTALRQSFHHALERNEWVTVWALMWDGNPLEKAEEDGVKSEDFTDDKGAQQAGFSPMNSDA